MDKADRLNRLEALFQLSESQDSIRKGKFFGNDVLRLEGHMFALVDANGAIGIRALSTELKEELGATKGADVWKCHGKVMSQWVLLPGDILENSEQLSVWLKSSLNTIREYETA